MTPRSSVSRWSAVVGYRSITGRSMPSPAPMSCTPTRGCRWVRTTRRPHRLQAFEGFTVDDALMASAAPDAVFMHCLPAYRGLEVTADVIDGPRSRVFRQGHNRLHAARGAFAFLVGGAASERETTAPTGDRPPDRPAAGRQPAAPARTARPRGRAHHPGDGVARPRRARRDQGARRRWPDGVCPPCDRDRSDRPLGAAPPCTRGVGRRRRSVRQHRHRAHAAGMRSRRRLGPRSQRDQRTARHGGR